MAPIIDGGTITALKQAITPIAQKIGEGAAHLYGVYVKQQVVVGIENFLIAVSLGVIIAVLIRFNRYITNNAIPSLRDLTPDSKTGLKIASTIVTIMFCAGMITTIAGNLAEGVKHTVNPEYYAVQDIINQFK